MAAVVCLQSFALVSADDPAQHAPLDEQVRHVRGLVEEPARIVAQVQDDPPRRPSAGAQRFLFRLRSRAPAEAVRSQVSDLIAGGEGGHRQAGGRGGLFRRRTLRRGRRAGRLRPDVTIAFRIDEARLLVEGRQHAVRRRAFDPVEPRLGLARRERQARADEPHRVLEGRTDARHGLDLLDVQRAPLPFHGEADPAGRGIEVPFHQDVVIGGLDRPQRGEQQLPGPGRDVAGIVVAHLEQRFREKRQLCQLGPARGARTRGAARLGRRLGHHQRRQRPFVMLADVGPLGLGARRALGRGRHASQRHRRRAADQGRPSHHHRPRIRAVVPRRKCRRLPSPDPERQAREPSNRRFRGAACTQPGGRGWPITRGDLVAVLDEPAVNGRHPAPGRGTQGTPRSAPGTVCPCALMWADRRAVTGARWRSPPRPRPSKRSGKELASIG